MGSQFHKFKSEKVSSLYACGCVDVSDTLLRLTAIADICTQFPDEYWAEKDMLDIVFDDYHSVTTHVCTGMEAIRTICIRHLLLGGGLAVSEP